MPFLLAAVSFVCAFLVLAACFWPFMVPEAITIAAAAGPEASLRFMFWGAGLFALPVIVIYTIVVYRVFRSGPVVTYGTAK
jgi:cytochrome d ubiquinol oxidase subunit II